MTNLGFPYPAINPLAFLVDDEIRPFYIDIRHDLTGTGTQACPIIATGIFIVHEHVVPDNTQEVILGVVPHCWERTGVGGATASVALISPDLTAGFVLFDNTKDNNQPYLVENNYNAATIAATPNDIDRQTLRGTTFLPKDAQLFGQTSFLDPLTTFALPARSLFRVLFRLMPTAAAAGVPNPYVIPPTAGAKRIDFAGALVFGMRMPQQTYDQLKKARREGWLGSEAAGRVREAR